MENNTNIYNIDLTDMGATKKRYTPKEKAERTVAIYQRIDSKKDMLCENLRIAIEPVIALAQESDTKEVVKMANKLAEKLAKVLGFEQEETAPINE